MSRLDDNLWQPMSNAPKDGTWVLVTIRASEQGPTEIDLVQWARPKPSHEKNWVASDSTYDCAIEYAEAELECWLPMPETDRELQEVYRSSGREPRKRSDEEIGGTGI